MKSVKKRTERDFCEQQQERYAQSRRGDDSPRLRCSSRRRREPCSGRCNTAGRPVCGTILLVERWKGGARRPTTERTPGLFPAWRSLVTSSAASACARWRTAAWWSSRSSSKRTIYPRSRGAILYTVMTLKVCTASIPEHTWPAFGTPAWTARHRKAPRADFNLACARRDSSGGLDRWWHRARQPRHTIS